jgi:hypothetical protein
MRIASTSISVHPRICAWNPRSTAPRAPATQRCLPRSAVDVLLGVRGGSEYLGVMRRLRWAVILAKAIGSTGSDPWSIERQ